MAKTSGKAKKKTKRPKKLREFEVGLIPFHSELTPARAKQWMKEEYPGFNEVARAGLSCADDRDDREAFSRLGYSVKSMVEACMVAIDSQKPVKTFSELAPLGKDQKARFVHIEQALRILRLPSIARDVLTETVGNPEIDALDLLARAIEDYTSAASRRESRSTDDVIRQMSEEREERDPHKRLDKLRERREALKAEQKAALAPVNEIYHRLAEPWERKLACLKYEEDLIWHKHGGMEHPGKPPEGYEPPTEGA